MKGMCEAAEKLLLDGRYAEAIRCYEAVIRDEPGNANAFWRLGQALMFSKSPNLAKADSCFRKACALEAAWADPVYSLAMVRERLGKNAEAERLYREASQIDPTDARPLTALGLLLVRQGRAREAMAPLETAVGLKPHYGLPDAMLLLAQACKDAECTKRAIVMCRRILSMEPEYPGYSELAKAATRLLREVGATERAIKKCGTKGRSSG